MPEAYERLIMDVIRGNQTLFMRGDEVEAAWEWTDPIIEAWEECGLAAAALRPGQRRADRRLQADRRATGTSGARSPRDRGGAPGLSGPGHADARPGGAGRRPAPRRRMPARGARRWRCRAAPRRGRSSPRCRRRTCAWEDVSVMPTDERMVSRAEPALERAADPRDAAAGTRRRRRISCDMLRADPRRAAGAGGGGAADRRAGAGDGGGHAHRLALSRRAGARRRRWPRTRRS